MMAEGFRKRTCLLCVALSIIVLLPDCLGEEKIQATFDYSDYAEVLKEHVNNEGMVNYKSLKANPVKLEAFVKAIGKIDNRGYEKWNADDRIAFLINAYNGLTLKVIIDNYPIKPTLFQSLVFPKNSIQQIPGAWDRIKFNVIGKDVTLDTIEHDMLRKDFNEPRIHMALVCASIGCPFLRNEPYIASRLNAQLDDQCRRFLANPAKFRIDRDKKVVYMSPIFDWYGKDFIKKYAPAEKIDDYDDKISAVLSFISAHLTKSDTEYILAGNFKVKYLNYDWSVNEQRQ